MVVQLKPVEQNVMDTFTSLNNSMQDPNDVNVDALQADAFEIVNDVQQNSIEDYS